MDAGRMLKLVVVLCGAVMAQAQPAPDQTAVPPEVPYAGFWPTDRMMDLFIDRFTARMGERYGFDDEQVLQTRDAIKSRFPVWLNEHRAEIQHLMNEYLESALAPEPPTPEQAADWARRALPLFQEGIGLVGNTMDEMTTWLAPEQAVRIERHKAGLAVAGQFLTQRLERWADGGFDPEYEWVGNQSTEARDWRAEQRDEARRRVEDARQAAEALGRVRRGLQPQAPPGAGGGAGGAVGGGDANAGAGNALAKPVKTAVDTAGVARDEWEVYVEEFIRRRQLSEQQANRARSYLRSAQKDRDRHLRKNLAAIQDMERELSAPQSDVDREALQKRYEKLTAPIDEGFDRLKQKLDGLLTGRQRDAER